MSNALFDIEVTNIAGETGNFEGYRGKVIMVVNTASKCGFTPQLKGLEELQEKYGDRGLVILGFPCNQFGAQDPGSNDEIATFCERNYGVSFTMHEKVDVNGGGTHPLFRLLKKERPGILNSEAIKWNFTKFLIDRTGKVVARIAPRVEPKDMRAKIERLLEA